MINPKRVFPLLCLLLLPLICNGQKWRNGHYITLENDTIYGQIRVPTKNKRAYTVLYRESESSKQALELNPEQVLFYAYEHKNETVFFKSIAMKGRIKPTPMLEKAFARKLVGGQLNLYVFYPFRGEKPAFYVERADSTEIYTYTKTDYIFYHSSEKRRLYYDRTLVRFGSTLQECIASTSYFYRRPYNIEEFAKLTVAYNKCKGNLTYQIKLP